MLKDRLFIFIYLLFIVSLFLIGQIKMPFLSININILLTVILFSICLIKERHLYNDKYLNYYWYFLFFYALSAIATGYFSHFFHFCYSSVLIAYVAYWSTQIFLKRYDYYFPPLILVSIGMLASIVTIFQGIGMPLSHPLLDAVIMDKDQSETLSYDGFNGGFALSGIYFSPVMNGHYLLFFIFNSFLLFKRKYRLVFYVSAIIIFVGLFFCQQRSAFFISVVSLILLVWYLGRSSNSLLGLFVLLTIIVLVIKILPTFNSIVDTTGSRLLLSSGTGRERIWPLAIDFISSNPIFCGNRLFFDTYRASPHNFFLSAIVSGGIFGGIILITLVVKLIIQSVKNIIYKNAIYSNFIISIMVLGLISDSMVHNFGLIEADYPMFMSLSLFHFFNNSENTEKRIGHSRR